MASVQNALAGLGAGFFGGYRDVLKLKMEEDIQARRDEATFNRAKNLKELEMTQQKEQFGETKNLQYAQLDAQKEHYAQQYDISKQQLAAQQEAAAASRAAAATAKADSAASRSEAQELRRLQFEFQKDMASGTYDVAKAKNQTAAIQAESDAFADRYSKAPLTPGETREDKDAKVALIKSMSITNPEQLIKATSKEGTVEFLREVAKDSLKDTSKFLESFGADKDGVSNKIEYATTSLGYRGVKLDGSVDKFITDKRLEGSVSSAIGAGRSQKSTPSPATREAPDLSQRLSADQLRSVAVGYLSGDKDTTALVDMYKKENPAVYDQIMRVGQGVKKERDISDQKGLLKQTQYEVW